MSGTFKLSSDSVPGYTHSGSKNFSNSLVSRRTLSLLPCSSCLDHNLQRLRCVNNSSSSFVCRASSGGYRRNPDSSRLDKHGYQGSNMQNGEREDFDVENSGMLSSRNGSLPSLSESPKFQATSLLGPKEKEIVEVFRKVQALLRARPAAKKEDRKIEEASKGQGKEIEAVDTLLKILRQQSGEQSNKNGSNSYPRQGETADKQVPRSKSPPAYSSEATFDQASSYSVTWTKKKDTAWLHDESEDEHEAAAEYELEPEYESEPEPVTTILEPESELKPDYVEEDDDGILDALTDDDESIDDDDEEDSDDAEEEAVKEEDLKTLKVMELRGIAKSKGLKGYSKMKKAELVELLGSSINSN